MTSPDRQAPSLLRAPPFPWVPPHVASVSASRPDGDPAAIADDGPALFEQIRLARVGGSFWGRAARLPADLDAVLLPATRDQARAMLAGVSRPVEAGGTRFCRAVAQVGRDTDPWSLLAAGVEIRADGDHEIVALAAIARVPVRVYGKGRFGSEAAGVDERAILDHLCCRTSYRDPFTGDMVEPGRIVELLRLWRDWIDANRTVAVAAGIAGWKRRTIARFLWAPRPVPMRFANDPGRAVTQAQRAHGGIAVWPSRAPRNLRELADRQAIPIASVEDGFLRSVGLGSALHQPWSIVVDRTGIYYDPSLPSDLERLLEQAEFPPALIARAQALRAVIVDGKVGKYGASAPLPDLPPRSRDGRRRVLVTGQVSDDLSIVRGSAEPYDACSLLQRVRRLEPDAEIWFRPHPDVDAGFRPGAVDDPIALRHADRIVRGGRMADLLAIVDGIHVLTSLSGFEALLRGIDVTVHATPFYAGWGLTRDLGPAPPRRTRRLTLDELVAATLILYPRYMDPVTKLPCPAEVLAGRLVGSVRPDDNWLTRARNLQGAAARWIDGRARRPRPGKQPF